MKIYFYNMYFSIFFITVISVVKKKKSSLIQSKNLFFSLCMSNGDDTWPLMEWYTRFSPHPQGVRKVGNV